MAGYIGTKAVLLSTTAADVVGNAEIGGDLTVGGAATFSGFFTSLGIDDNAAATAITIDASGNVGIGTATPTFSSGTFTGAHIHAQNGAALRLTNFGQGQLATDGFDIQHDSGGDTFFVNRDSGNLRHYTGGSERMRIDSSGNVLVGTTAYTGNTTNSGGGIREDGLVFGSTPNGAAAVFNRLTSDGDIALFRKNGTTVGSIGSQGGLYVYMGSTSGTDTHTAWANGSFKPSTATGTNLDNVMDCGNVSARWDDIYATNGTIQTSDRNEKEAIASLTPTEMLVAARLSSSFKNFKWKDAVAEKGAAARMHSGIIAQDVQDAFAAEGLDASDYAMFISGTWWEHEGTTYDTLEEAPEGATERTRLGVRYPELLAFVAAYNDQRFLTIEARLTALEATP